MRDCVCEGEDEIAAVAASRKRTFFLPVNVILEMEVNGRISLCSLT